MKLSLKISFKAERKTEILQQQKNLIKKTQKKTTTHSNNTHGYINEGLRKRFRYF